MLERLLLGDIYLITLSIYHIVVDMLNNVQSLKSGIFNSNNKYTIAIMSTQRLSMVY